MKKPHVKLKHRLRPTVVALPPPVSPPEVHSVIAQYEQLAADGTLCSIAVAAVNYDGSVSSAYYVGRNLFTMIGSVRNVARRIENEAAG